MSARAPRFESLEARFNRRSRATCAWFAAGLSSICIITALWLSLDLVWTGSFGELPVPAEAAMLTVPVPRSGSAGISPGRAWLPIGTSIEHHDVWVSVSAFRGSGGLPCGGEGAKSALGKVVFSFRHVNGSLVSPPRVDADSDVRCKAANATFAIKVVPASAAWPQGMPPLPAGRPSPFLASFFRVFVPRWAAAFREPPLFAVQVSVATKGAPFRLAFSVTPSTDFPHGLVRVDGISNASAASPPPGGGCRNGTFQVTANAGGTALPTWVASKPPPDLCSGVRAFGEALWSSSAPAGPRKWAHPSRTWPPGWIVAVETPQQRQGKALGGSSPGKKVELGQCCGFERDG